MAKSAFAEQMRGSSVNANVSQMKSKPTPMASSIGGQFAAMENALLQKPKKKKSPKVVEL